MTIQSTVPALWERYKQYLYDNRALGFKQRFQSAIDTYLCVAIVV